MTAPFTTYVDGAASVKAWLTNQSVLGTTKKRVFFGKPRGEHLPDSFITISEVTSLQWEDVGDGGGIAEYEVQLETWCKKSKEQAAALAYAIVGLVKRLVNGTAMGDAFGAQGEITLGPVWRPEDDAEYARYVIGARFLLRSAAE